jgi:hypothetical protein
MIGSTSWASHSRATGCGSTASLSRTHNQNTGIFASCGLRTDSIFRQLPIVAQKGGRNEREARPI